MNLRRALLAIVLLLNGPPGCSDESATSKAVLSPGAPVLLIGVDGLEWNVILPMLREGRLPHIESLMRRGSFGLLESIKPTMSPIVWTSVATGKKPKAHGITNFVYQTRGQDGKPEVHLFTSRDRRTKALWDILSDYRLGVNVIGWWMTFPVDAIQGVMVAQTNTTLPGDQQLGKGLIKGSLVRGIPGQVHPPERQDEMLEILEQADQQLEELAREVFGEFPHPLSMLGRRLWEHCLWSFRADTTYIRISEKLAGQKPPPALTAIYLGGPDVVGHRFWRYMVPDLYDDRPSPEEVETLGSVIRDNYAYVDDAVGRLLDLYPPDTTVIIVSDHGMSPYNTHRRFLPDAPMRLVSSGHHWEAPPGVFVAAGSRIRKLGLSKPVEQLQRSDLPVVGSVLDICPTILAMLTIPIGKDMKGEVLRELLRTDFLETYPPRKVRSHDTRAWRAARARDEPQAPSPNEEERLEQLRSLGYIK